MESENERTKSHWTVSKYWNPTNQEYPRDTPKRRVLQWIESKMKQTANEL